MFEELEKLQENHVQFCSKYLLNMQGKINYKDITQKEMFNEIFKEYVKEEKQIDLGTCDQDSVHDLWRRFVKRWNDGKMKSKWYSLGKRISQPSYARLVGPSRPTLENLQDRRELQEQLNELRKLSRKSAFKSQAKRETELLDEILPKEPAGSKEAMQQKKKEKRAALKHYREASDNEEDLKETDLYGDRDSFQSRLKQKKQRSEFRASKREMERLERDQELRNKIEERNKKELETIEKLRELAKARLQGFSS